MTLGSDVELKKTKKLEEEEIVKRQSEDNLFRKNHGLLGLFDMPAVWWFSETSVFCLSGHLSALWSEIYKNQGPYLLRKA